MLYYFLTAFPVELDDVVHEFAASFEVQFDLPLLLFVVYLLLMYMLFTVLNHLLRIDMLLLRFFVKVISHPLQLFQQEVPMAFMLILPIYLSLVLKERLVLLFVNWHPDRIVDCR